MKISGEDVSKTENWEATTGAYLDEHILLVYFTPDEYFETHRKIYGLSEPDLKHHLDKFTELFNDEVLGKKKYIRYLREKSEMMSELDAYFTG